MIFFFNYSNLFIYRPIIIFSLSSAIWILYPRSRSIYFIEFRILFILLALRVYPILFVGWISNCNYAILYGSIRFSLILELQLFSILHHQHIRNRVTPFKAWIAELNASNRVLSSVDSWQRNKSYCRNL